MRDYHKSPVEIFTEIGPVGGALIHTDEGKNEYDEVKQHFTRLCKRA